MKHLLSKSESNLAAASFLYENSYFPAVVHCCYYSCLQLCSHIWEIENNNSVANIKDICRFKQTSSHEFLMKEIKDLLKTRNRGRAREYQNKFLDLKKFRVRSDYNNEPIDPETCQRAISLSEKIQKILKSQFSYE